MDGVPCHLGPDDLAYDSMSSTANGREEARHMAAWSELTNYFSETQRRANLTDLELDRSTPHRRVDRADITAGKLDGDATTWILDQAAAQRRGTRAKCAAEPAPVPVLISLVTLRQGGRRSALLVLPATLAPDGALSSDPGADEPWIPASRLHTEGVADREVMVGDLSAFWRWRHSDAPEAASQVEGWSDAVAYADRMFDAVASRLPARSADGAGVIIEREQCYVVPGAQIVANRGALDLYDAILRQDTLGLPSPYERLVSLAHPERTREDHIDDDVTRLCNNAKRVCGSMSDSYGLTASQRRAVHAFMEDGDGDVTAVSGPPGTGKTTMLQAIVASLVVQHALDGAPAPLIVGTSATNQAVTNIIDSFSKVTKDDPGLIDHRWIPRAGSAAETAPVPLSGLATYCPSQAKTSAAKESGYLTEDIRKTGVYSEYSTPEYLEIASDTFLTKVQAYAEQARLHEPTSLDDAVKILKTALAELDRTRRTLIDVRSRLDIEAGISSTVLDDPVEPLAIEWNRVFEKRALWTKRAEDAVAHPDEAAYIVAMNRDADDPDSLQSCEELRGYYEDRLKSVLTQMDRARSASAAARARLESARATFTKEATPTRTWLRNLGHVPDERLDRLLSAPTLLDLEKQLDVTVRYAEFWLAVHLYEAQWLLTISGDELLPPDQRWQRSSQTQARYWAQVAALTPCFVMTVFQLPKYFSLYTKPGEAPEFDLGRADLLIIDEAGQVDTSLGACAAALARRALVVGDERQLAPVWSIDPVSDEEGSAAFGLSARWSELVTSGLTASDHSSLMRAASHASRWSYGEDDDPGLFLSEHFRCHPDIIDYCNRLLYKGLLEPSRPVENYLLKNRVPGPFLFHLVAGSKDRTKGSSRVNDVEAEAIATWIVDHIATLRQIYNPEGSDTKERGIIGVVTPFHAQEIVINECLRRKDEDLARTVTVGTAHKLQGAERHVVLFSSVYGDASGQASFIDSTLELMNVAVSRAKDLFVVFGGEGRRNDSGPVFSLVRELAKPDEPWVGDSEPGTGPSGNEVAEAASLDAGAPAPSPSEGRPASDADTAEVTAHAAHARQKNPEGPPVVDRETPGYEIVSAIASRIGGITAHELNEALIAAGLLQRVNGDLLPTVDGIAAGIAVFHGESKRGPYTAPIYSAAARALIVSMADAGELPTA